MENIIEKSVVWAVELTNEVIKALEDGKINIWEGVGFTDNGINGIQFLRFYKNFPDDWTKLSKDQDYTNKVISSVEGLGINNDKAKRLTVQIVKAGIEIGKVIDIALEK